MIELLFADCNCQSLTKKFPLRCQKFPHSSQISSQISVGFANFVDMGTWACTAILIESTNHKLDNIWPFPNKYNITRCRSRGSIRYRGRIFYLVLLFCFNGTVDRSGVHKIVRKRATLLKFFLFITYCFAALFYGTLEIKSPP